MDNLRAVPIKPGLVTPFGLTYHLTPWSYYSLVVGTSHVISLPLLDRYCLEYLQSESETVINCLDHSVDAISLINILKRDYALPELCLMADHTVLSPLGQRKANDQKQIVKISLGKELTYRLSSNCHNAGMSVTAYLAELFRPNKTRVAITTNLRSRLNLPANSVGNLSGGIIFRERERITRKSIHHKLERHEDIRALRRLLNSDPEHVTQAVLKSNERMLSGKDSKYPRLIISNLGRVEIETVNYLYFIPPTVPIADALTIGIVTLNGCMTLVLSSWSKPDYSEAQVIQDLERIL